jgi:sugar fermentation stimulation protein A
VQKITDAKSGIYILELSSAKNFKVGIKKFSDIKLNSGFYYYIGSAQKNYNSRLVRHLKKSKTIHWHIDHLTTNAFLKINKIYLLENSNKELECGTVQLLEQLRNINHPLEGFGNSDCKVCKSHLLYSKDEIAYSHFISLYQDIVLFKPSDKDTF